MKKTLSAVALLSLCLGTSYTYAFNQNRGYLLLEAGAYHSTQGQNQDINIIGLIGNHFDVTDRHDPNGLIGFGYLLPGIKQSGFEIDYGINAFYLVKARVRGTITQELMFTNLAYSYDVSHLPIYATAKARIKSGSDKVNFTLDAGIGPNFMRTSNYRDWSIDGGMTLPDRAFFGNTKTTFSATAGIAVQLNNLFKTVPIEIGYRFFYLGDGDFNKRTNQLLNTLRTGRSYANALVVTATV